MAATTAEPAAAQPADAPKASEWNVWHPEGATPAFFTQHLAGRVIEGPLINALGYNWRVCISDAVDVTVRLLSPKVVQEVTWVVGIGGVIFSETRRFSTLPYETKGSDQLVMRRLAFPSELVARGDVYFKGGTLALKTKCKPKCDTPEPADVACKWHNSVPQPPGLALAFAGLLASGLYADVTLACADGEHIAAHALVLSARSPVFAASLERQGPRAAGAPRPPLLVQPEITSRTLRRLLQYIYTGELEPLEKEAQHLLHAADVYDVRGLFCICERVLGDSLCARTAAHTLQLADQHSAAELKRVTLLWMANRKMAASVIASNGWRRLAAKRRDLVTALLHTMATGKPPGHDDSEADSGVIAEGEEVDEDEEDSDCEDSEEDIRRRNVRARFG